jgi:type II secretory pathway component PulF
MPEPPKELPAFPNEAAFQQKLKERRQRVEELEVEQKPSIHNCVFISIFWFFLTMVFPILMTYIIPKFKTIFADMLGPGETLPEFTLLVMWISDIIKNNAPLPLWGSLWLGFAYFMGFKRRFLEKNLCKIINVLSILLFAFVLLSVIIAMFLPLIKMKDKLGQ